MTVPSEASARGRYRVVRPPERQDHSGQNLIRGFGISQTTAGSRHLSMAYGEVPIGATSERHYHPFETAVFIIAGVARSYFGAHDEDCVDVEAGDFVYIPADCPTKQRTLAARQFATSSRGRPQRTR